MAFQNKSYVVGKEKAPLWLNEEAAAGRVRANYEDGEMVNMLVYTTTGSIVAKVGDIVVLLKSGLSVIPASEAKKYGVQKEAHKEE